MDLPIVTIKNNGPTGITADVLVDGKPLPFPLLGLHVHCRAADITEVSLTLPCKTDVKLVAKMIMSPEDRQFARELLQELLKDESA